MKKTPEDLVNDIQEACAQLGWCVGMDESNSTIKGLIIGKQSFIEDIVSSLSDGDTYSIYQAAAEISDKH